MKQYLATNFCRIYSFGGVGFVTVGLLPVIKTKTITFPQCQPNYLQKHRKTTGQMQSYPIDCISCNLL